MFDNRELVKILQATVIQSNLLKPWATIKVASYLN